jgi:hypothetical protein
MTVTSGSGSPGALDFPPPACRTIVGWIEADRILREWPQPGWGREHNECYGHLEAWLSDECSQEHTRRDDRSPVQDFLPTLADKLSAKAADLGRGRDPAVGTALRRLAKDFERAAASFGGDPVAELVDWVRRATAACYRDVAPGIATRLGAVRTRIGLTSGIPDGAVSSWLVAGSAEPDEGPVAVVGLDLASRLDRPTWRAVPYVLLHEYLSHAAQGPWSAVCRRPAQTDMFAEGWMDVVTFGLHQALVDGLGGVERLPDAPSVQAEAAGLYAVRRRGVPTLSHTRRLGYETAEELRRVVPTETFFRLSLALNVSTAPHARRQDFVWGVRKALGRGDQARIASWIAGYERDGDLPRLLASVLAYYAAP